MADVPTHSLDLFSDATLAHTSQQYRALRDSGPIVYLTENELYAATHYDSVRAALRAHDVLISGQGVAANELLNGQETTITLFSDGATHKRRRSVLVQPLVPEALKSIAGTIEQRAEELVRDLAQRDSFCVVKDFASHLPLSVIAELVGLSDYGRERMLGWAAAAFNLLGPLNERANSSIATLVDMQSYVQHITKDQLRPGSWAAQVLTAGEDGRLSQQEAVSMIADYIAPSLDTTILATAHMFWFLATTPDAYTSLRANPDLVPSMVDESVRLSSPIRGFTRYAATPFVYEGMVVPEGARIVMLYASGNWDERKYPDPDHFNIARNPKDHLAWGHGIHFCGGKFLARLEMEQLAYAMLRHGQQLSVGEPEILMNNVLQGFASLPGAID